MKSLTLLLSVSVIVAFSGCGNKLASSELNTPECQIMFERMGKGSFWLSEQDPDMIRNVIVRCGDSLK